MMTLEKSESDESGSGYWANIVRPGSLVIVAGILALNIAIGFYEIKDIYRESEGRLRTKLEETLQHLRSVASVMALDGYLASSIEEENYAESMRNIVAFREGHIADSIAIYQPKGTVFADAEMPGYFGKQDSLSGLAREVTVTGNSRDIVVERNGRAHLYVLTCARSLNGPVGTFAVGKDLDKFFTDLGSQNSFGLKDIKLTKTTDGPHPWNQMVFKNTNDLPIPIGWEIRAFAPQWNSSILHSVIRGLLSILMFLTFFRTWNRNRVSQQKLRNEELRRISSARLVALGEMCAGISHEINNPLAVIKMSGQQLKFSLSQHKLPEQFLSLAEENCERIDRTSVRIAAIIKGLRAFARDDTLEPMTPASLRQIVNDALELNMARMNYKAVALRLNLNLPDDKVNCRSIQLSQVVLNLLNNALDAIEATPSPWISIDLRRGNKFIELAVTDSGPGIPHSLHKKVMEPFFTTKPHGKGTGIGLSIASGIVQSHGGTLVIDKTCANTRFVMTLPSISI